MNILLIAPNEISVPPYQGYGGTERVVYDLALQFVDKNHTVDIICKEGSQLAHKGINAIYYPQKKELDFILKFLSHYNRRYDIIHLHIFEEDYVSKISDICSPVITSIHYYIDSERASRFDKIDSCYLTQSKSQARYYKKYIKKVEGILQGIRMEHIPFSDKVFKDIPEKDLSLDFHIKMKERGIEKYLLMLSKISRRKGQLTAIQLAKKHNLPIVLAGEPKDDHQNARETSINYFHGKIEPHFDEEQVLYFGNADENEKYELMKYAHAFLFPTGFEDDWWEEAFGRVVAESLATGTPVVAHKKGAMPEQIIDGQNGYLFSTFEEALEKLKRVDEISRTFCRDDAHQRLSSERFARECLEFYQTLSN